MQLNSSATIKEIKGDRELVFHFYDPTNGKEAIKGGVTVIYDPSSNMMSSSLCCVKDKYNRRRGYEICKARLNMQDKISQRMGRNASRREFSCLKPYTGERNIHSIREAAQSFAVECGNEKKMNRIIQHQQAHFENRRARAIAKEQSKKIGG